MARNKQQPEPTTEVNDPPEHPLGPVTPSQFLEPDFAITGATGMDASVEDPQSFNLRRDTPPVTELIPPQQAFHSTPIDEEYDPRGTVKLAPLPLTAEQQETLTIKEYEPTDVYIQEKFVVSVNPVPSERWSIAAFTFPAQDALAAIRVADRQERRASCLLVNTGATTISIGPSQSSLVPFLLAGAALKLDTLAAIYANAASGSMVVIEELSE